MKLLPVWELNTYSASLEINIVNADNGLTQPNSGIAVPSISTLSDININAIEHGTILSLDSSVSPSMQDVFYKIDGDNKYQINVNLQSGKVYQDWYKYVGTEYSVDNGATWQAWTSAITLTQDIKVRSNWKVMPRDFSVEFYDVADGTYQENPKMISRPENISFNGYQTITLPDASAITDSKGLYNLVGWAYNGSDKVKVFEPGATISWSNIDTTKFSSDKLTLKPVWELKEFTMTYSSVSINPDGSEDYKNYNLSVSNWT